MSKSTTPAAEPVVEPLQGEAGKPLAEVTDREIEAIRNETARTLAAQPKVRIRLPNLPDVPRDKQPDEVVQVNGYTYQIQRGVFVEVPQTVFEILEHAGRL